MPTIKQLQYFQALAKEQNMNSLSSKFFISQSALSNSLSRLENELGVTLFERTATGLKINKYGKVYLEYVDRILELLEASTLSIRDDSDSDKKRLNVLFNSPILYSSMIFDFIRKYPDIEVSQHTCSKEIIESHIKENKSSVYLVGVDDYYFPPYFDNKIIYKDILYVGVPSSHKFAQKKSITLEDCRNEPFIFQEIESGFSQFSIKLFEEAGIKPNIIAWCDHSMRKVLFSQGAGIVLTSETNKRAKFFKDCIYIPLKPTKNRIMVLYWRTDTEPSQIVNSYIDFVSNYFSDIYM